MKPTLSTQDFARDQPGLLAGTRGAFAPPSISSDEYASSDPSVQIALRKIAQDLNAGRYAEAAIRFVQTPAVRGEAIGFLMKAGFDSAQPRNARGEWSSAGTTTDTPSRNNRVAVNDPYCKLVKQL